MTLYMYALVDRRPAELKRLGRGIGGAPLSIVRAGKVFVIVGSGGARSPVATRAALVAHDRVVRRIVRLCPAVLPLRFGATAPDRAAVQGLVLPLGDRLGVAFDRVRDAVQFTLRVSGPKRKASPAIDATGPGTRWLAERMARKQVPEVASVVEATRPFVRATRAERSERVSNEVPPRLGTVYQLVAREDVRGWRAALAKSLRSLPRSVRVSVTGPWPAWAFAELGE